MLQLGESEGTPADADRPPSLPWRALRLVRTRRLLHLEEFEQAWNLAARDQQPGTIAPQP